MKKADIEIAGRCYVKCIMCNMHSKDVKVVPLHVALYRLRKLHDAGFTTVRITGREPMTYPWLNDVFKFMSCNYMNIDMTTTLLTPRVDEVNKLYLLSKIRVSIVAMYKNYKNFYTPDNFSTFVTNLRRLREEYDGTIYFNYTFTSDGRNGMKNYTVQSAQDIVRLVDTIGLTNYCFNLFPAIEFQSGVPEAERELMASFTYVLDINNITYNDCNYIPKKVAVCTITDKRLFVKHDGSVYPCCNTSGEVGQDVIPQAYLGNIDNDELSAVMAKAVDTDNVACNNCTPKYTKLM